MNEPPICVIPFQPDWPEPSGELLAEMTRNRRIRIRDSLLFLLGVSLIGVALALAHLAPGILLLLLLTPFAFNEAWTRELPTNARLIDSSGQDDETFVEILVEVDSVVRGSDRGVLWTTDNCLYFLGQRTWFRITRQDLLQVRRGSPRMERYSELYSLKCHSILSLDISAPVRIGINPKEKRGGNSDPLSELLFQFRHQEDPSELGTRLPPLSFDPCYMDPMGWAGRISLALAFITLGLFSAGFILILFQQFVFASFFCGLPTTILIGMTCSPFVHAYRNSPRQAGTRARLKARRQMRAERRLKKRTAPTLGDPSDS